MVPKTCPCFCGQHVQEHIDEPVLYLSCTPASLHPLGHYNNVQKPISRIAEQMGAADTAFYGILSTGVWKSSLAREALVS